MECTLQTTKTSPLKSLALRGFVPGASLRLFVGRGASETTLSTVVEVITDERFEVLVPIYLRRTRSVPEGTPVRVEYSYQRKVWSFTSQVIGHSKDRAFEYLRLPAEIQATERRGHFRLSTSLQPTEAFVVRDGPEGEPPILVELARPLIADLSEGGLLLACQGPVGATDRIQLRMALDDFGEVALQLRVALAEEPARKTLSRRLHCQFVDISRADRERIARYLMRRQIALRKAGRL